MWTSPAVPTAAIRNVMRFRTVLKNPSPFPLPSHAPPCQLWIFQEKSLGKSRKFFSKKRPKVCEFTNLCHPVPLVQGS